MHRVYAKVMWCFDCKALLVWDVNCSLSVLERLYPNQFFSGFLGSDFLTPRGGQHLENQPVLGSGPIYKQLSRELV